MTPLSQHSQYLATRHFGSLDGLRFLSISAVIWHHGPLWAKLTGVSVFFSRGHVGVDLFFVLSGYLITTLLLREEAARGRFSLPGFYRRRILRIFPVYYLVISVAAFYEIVLKGETGSLSILPFYYLFMSNFIRVEDIGFLAPTWSLSVEEQYYLIWPALLLLVPRRWIVPVLVGLIAINVAVATGAFSWTGITEVETPLLRFGLGAATYAPILMGSLAALLLHSPAGFARIRPLFSPRPIPWICLGLLLTALAAFPGKLEGWPNLAVHSLMTCLVISLVIREDNGMAPVLKLPLLARIGQISYGIYLYHLFALSVMAAVFARLGFDHPGLLIPAYYILAIGMAEVSFRIFEAWFMRFRHRPSGQAPAAPLADPTDA